MMRFCALFVFLIFETCHSRAEIVGMPDILKAVADVNLPRAEAILVNAEASAQDEDIEVIRRVRAALSDMQARAHASGLDSVKLIERSVANHLKWLEHKKAEDFDAAVEDLRMAIVLDFTNAKAMEKLHTLYVEAGDKLNSARWAYQIVSRVDPKHFASILDSYHLSEYLLHCPGFTPKMAKTASPFGRAGLYFWSLAKITEKSKSDDAKVFFERSLAYLDRDRGIAEIDAMIAQVTKDRDVFLNPPSTLGRIIPLTRAFPEPDKDLKRFFRQSEKSVTIQNKSDYQMNYFVRWGSDPWTSVSLEPGKSIRHSIKENQEREVDVAFHQYALDQRLHTNKEFTQFRLPARVVIVGKTDDEKYHFIVTKSGADTVIKIHKD